ncbi:Threonine efflux protein [Pantoea agglomerans]|uniref:Threonine efflux protein n=1 Tax=Enterobacter agglomerans TaxID=549 RepID=A0A379AP36_ENTAG|nr:Threonine efflux protein [Pantoea agglomerans]
MYWALRWAFVVWAGVALMGLHLILEKMAWLHQIIMVGGGLYLLWMGWQLMCSARQRHKQPQQDEPVVALPKRGMSFLKGLLTNLSNPKAIILLRQRLLAVCWRRCRFGGALGSVPADCR